MWYPATVSVAATAEPVSGSEAQDHLRAGVDGPDASYITLLIAAARNHVEAYCGARFATQTVVAKCDAFVDMVRLPEAPVQSVSSVSYVDSAGITTTLATSVYELRSDGMDAAIVLKYGQVWPVIQPGSRIAVTMIVGYATVPPAVKAAMLLRIGEAYENREGATGSAWGAMDSLLSNYRRGV